MRLEYGKIMAINEKTSLLEAKELGELFAEELRPFVAENDWVSVMQFLWDANIVSELGNIIHALDNCSCVDDVSYNLNLLGWIKHTRPAFTVICSMLENLIGDPMALRLAKINFQNEIYSLMDKSKKAQTKELLGNCSFYMTTKVMHDFLAYVIFFTGDPVTYRKNLASRAAKEIERGHIKKNPGSGVIMFYSAVKMYLDMVEKVFLPFYEKELLRMKTERAEKRKILASKASEIKDEPICIGDFKIAENSQKMAKSMYLDNGFKNNPFTNMRR